MSRVCAVIRDRHWILPCVVFLVAFTVRLGIVLAFGVHKQPYRFEMQKIALSFARTNVYGNPFRVPTGPTAHYTPAYPLLLSAVYRVFGDGIEGELASYILNIALSSLTYSLIPMLSMALGLRMSIGAAASFFGALFPISFFNEIRGGEISLAAILVLYHSWITINMWKQQIFRVNSALIQGVLWGTALLVSPSLLPIFWGFFISSLLIFRQLYRKIIVYFTLVLFISAILLMPWAIRNYYAFGSVIFLRSNFGLELQVSNNDLAMATIDENLTGGAYDAFHPFTSLSEAERLKYVGEVSYNRKKMSDALQWMLGNPKRFAGLTFHRFLFFWFPKTTRSIQSALFWIMSFCALGGLFLLYLRDKLAAALISSIWLTFPNIYYFVQANIRYRYPIYWTILLLGALFVIEIGSSLWSSVTRQEGARSQGGKRYLP
jgi:hypothetical protein